jgi:hypothetical protein
MTATGRPGRDANADVSRRRGTSAGASRSLVALAAGALALTALVLLATGAIAAPDFNWALAHLSDRLGSWTYVLVGVAAFLETRRSSA